MNIQTGKTSETVNINGATESKVDTKDYHSSAGQGQEERNVQVVHQPHPSKGSTTSGGVLAGAAAAVESTLESAKDAISGPSGK
ncbi:Small GTPase superfamily, ARF type [Quillaja saponaria]|uniref:Small GTPase superfamily, ARF type n=1 Tax=Quillaja saponaria TaxID=32244 RepID=A0AAD7KRK8_QUISA|nr:Small GTPase superfamily, ARF type [Quillaja saponaria]